LSKHFRLANRPDQATFNKSARRRSRG
jgi:hypothetical protein